MEILSQLNSLKNSSAKRNKHFEKWNSTLGSQLAALRNKIEQTKHLTNGVLIPSFLTYRFFQTCLILFFFQRFIYHYQVKVIKNCAFVVTI